MSVRNPGRPRTTGKLPPEGWRRIDLLPESRNLTTEMAATDGISAMSHYVLLCDDEVHIVRAAEIKLSRAGYEVDIACDGEVAWQKILVRRPDMIVTDLQMPHLDGLGLVQRLRENASTSDVPVVMLTAKGFELSFEELAARWRIQKLMAKPFSPRELLDVVNKTLRPELAQAGAP